MSDVCERCAGAGRITTHRSYPERCPECYGTGSALSVLRRQAQREQACGAAFSGLQALAYAEELAVEDRKEEQAARRAGHDTGYERRDWPALLSRKGPTGHGG
jgi:hypothetical protein